MTFPSGSADQITGWQLSAITSLEHSSGGPKAGYHGVVDGRYCF